MAETAADDQNDALTAALRYAALGYRVVPIGIGTKHPPLEAWQDKATTNAETIRLWWRNNPGYGVGIATGRYGDRWLFAVDIDCGTDRSGRVKEGDETVYDLEAEHGPLPDTVEGQSGSGGRHLWFWSPVEIHNDQAGRLGLDVDIRGVGGQIVVAPTAHPDNGRRYAWVNEPGDDIDVADAPAWLVDLLTRRTAGDQPRRTIRLDDGGGDRPGDRWVGSWPDLLEADGATFLGRRRDRRTGHDYELWARPGVDHTSATLYYGGSDVLKVFTPNWPGLEQGETYTRFGYLTATKFGGDFKAAAAALRHANDPFAGGTGTSHEQHGTSHEPTGPGGDRHEPAPDDDDTAGNWQPADLAAALAGGLTRPTPTVLRRTDGAALFYRGRTNTVFGGSGAGKTWALYIAAAQLMCEGDHVIIIDFEDDEVGYLIRMLALGVPGELVVANSTYYAVSTGATGDDLDTIDRLIARRQTALIGIDSTGEALAAQGLDQDKDPDVARWMATMPRRWARQGPCVIMLDHVPHAGGREIGSQRKRAAVSGAAYEAVATAPFSRQQAGVLTLRVAKDRGGNYAKDTEQAIISFLPQADGTVMGTTVTPGSGITTRARSDAEILSAVVDHLETSGPSSKRDLRAAIHGDNSRIDAAISVLVKAGRIVAGKGQYSLADPVDNTDQI